MRKVICSVFLFFMTFLCSSSLPVLANNEVNKVDIYLDGYPMTGKIIGGTSDVNVYDIPSSGDVVIIDTIPVGSSVNIVSLNVLNNSTNYFYVSYSSGDEVARGYILFDFVEPIDAAITPAPGVNIDYEEPDLSKFFSTIMDFVYGVINFFASLHNYLLVLFPFLTDTQVNFFITFASLFMTGSLYFLFRKVFI